ncbi:hypothetical protein [Pedobacter hartonius]|nr:hypothetical protein [Pedobacter hartonius]
MQTGFPGWEAKGWVEDDAHYAGDEAVVVTNDSVKAKVQVAAIAAT